VPHSKFLNLTVSFWRRERGGEGREGKGGGGTGERRRGRREGKGEIFDQN
jgi:hypothetical protein